MQNDGANFHEILALERFILILRTSSAEDAIERALVALDLGVKLVEVTFTVPQARTVIRELSRERPESLIGAGTVLDEDQCREAVDSGARFVLAPNFDVGVLKVCREAKVPYVPGVMTPSEIANALRHGVEVLKLFPGELLGPTFVRAMRGPFPSAKFVITGGVSLENVESWFEAGAFAVGVGGNLMRKDVETYAAELKVFLEKVRKSDA